MTLILYKAFAAILILLMSLITALYPLKKKTRIKQAETAALGEALASGIFLGAAFFHLLPDALNTFEKLYGTLSYPIPEAICVAGFLLLLFLERLSALNAITRSTHTIPYILALMLIIHALIEGAALGIGATLSETFMIFIAILAHKGSESFALCMAMLRHKLPLKQITLIVIFFALMTPLGIGFGALINQFTFARSGELVSAIFNAFAAGTFLYISTLHHTHFHKHQAEAQGLVEFASLALGTIAMGLIALWA